MIYGSGNKDFLQGGTGSDTIYGGGGDDVILGNGHIRFGQKSQVVYTHNAIGWSPTVVSGIHPLVPNMGGAKPTITAGAFLSTEYRFDRDAEIKQNNRFLSYRDPKVFAWQLKIDDDVGDYTIAPHADIPLSDNYHALASYNAHDTLYGGAGNDLIVGQYGNDRLYGAEGDDILWGDDNRDLAIMGDDYLNGGTGRDKLYGGLGFDTYDFSLNDLRRAGDDNKYIMDSDNSGRIVIAGQDLTDLLFYKNPHASNVYETQDGKLTLLAHEDSYSLNGTDFDATIAIAKTADSHLGVVLGMSLAAEVKNTAPTVTNPIKNQVIALGDTVWIDVAAAFDDADGDDLTYSASYLPAGLHLTGGMLSGYITQAASKIIPITITAKDPHDERASVSFTIITNHKPTIAKDITITHSLKTTAA